jgi:type VI secretion system protein ImpH
MAAEDRADARSVALLGALQQAPAGFDLFQALRRIECVFRDRARLGEGQHASDEPVRLAQEPSLAFSPHPISSVETDSSGRPRFVTAFFGLLGPHGPLPLHLTDYARDRVINAGDRALVRFLDLFHHRMISLFYRAFANAQPVVSRDRPESDRYMTYVGSLFGFGLDSLRNRDAVPDLAKLYLAGRLAAQPRNADGLRAMIHEFFGIPTEVEQFVGEWVDLPVRSRWRLGGAGVGSALGRATAIGRRAWTCQGKFRVVVGPLQPEQFSNWLPGGKSLERLEAMIQFYVGDQLSWDVRLILGDQTRQPWRLGKQARLGWTSWLGSRPTSLVVKPSQARSVLGDVRANPSTPQAQRAEPGVAPCKTGP